MNGGLIAFLAGILAMIGAWIVGRRAGRESQKEKDRTVIFEAKAEARTMAKVEETLSDATPIYAEAARRKGISEAEHAEVVMDIEKARRSNDMDAMLQIARRMAEKAMGRGAEGE